jgi:tryptophan-rich hypothetical protein
MNRVQKNKLKLSKWTAVESIDKEKHFIVTDLLDEESAIPSVVLEAIYSKRALIFPWTELKDDSVWRHGWR